MDNLEPANDVITLGSKELMQERLRVVAKEPVYTRYFYPLLTKMANSRLSIQTFIDCLYRAFETFIDEHSPSHIRMIMATGEIIDALIDDERARILAKEAWAKRTSSG